MAANEDKFTWRIEKFSTLKDAEIHSPTFSLKGHQWKICFHPRRKCFGSRCMNIRAVLEFADSESSLEKTLYNNLQVVRPVRNYECDEIAELYNLLWDGVFSDISETMPRTKEELKQLCGIGKEELRQYGDQILQIVASIMSDYNRVREEGSGSKGNKSSDSAKRKRTTATIEPPEAINDLSTEPLSTENQEPGVSKDAYDQDGWVSVSTTLSSKVARTSTVVSPCSSNVQSTSKNLIAELSTMASSWKSTSVDDAQKKSTNDENMDSALLQEQRGKLAEFFEMSLEAICQANWFDKVHEIVLKISDLATDPFEKTVLKDLLSHLETTKQLKESLLDRQNELALLDSEVSRIEKDQLKVDAEIQQLLARKEKLVHGKNSALAKMEAANKEASRGLRELKRKQAEHEQAMDNLMTAKEKLTQNNASWKLFKENLGLFHPSSSPISHGATDKPLTAVDVASPLWTATAASPPSTATAVAVAFSIFRSGFDESISDFDQNNRRFQREDGAEAFGEAGALVARWDGGGS
ncbi:ATP-dependent DNA helicase Q-like 4A [Linum perenne]